MAEFVKENEIKLLDIDQPKIDQDEEDLDKELNDMMATLDESGDTSKSGTEENQEENQTIRKTVTASQESTESQSKSLIDLVIPDLSQFCSFVGRLLCDFEQEQDYESMTEEDLFELQAIYSEYFKFFLLYEIGDPAQKKIVANCMRDILLHRKIADKIPDYINPIMQMLGKNVFNSTELLDFTVEISNEIQSMLELELYGKPPLPMDERQLQQMKAKCAEVKVKILELKEIQNLATDEKRFEDAGRIEREIQTLEREEKAWKDKMKGDNQNFEREIDINISDHELYHYKLLCIFSGCIQYGVYHDITSLIKTRIDTLVMPGIVRDDDVIRTEAVKALGLCCFINPQLASKHYFLFNVIATNVHEMPQVRHAALSAIFDVVCEHGIEVLANPESTNASKGNVSKRTDEQTQSDGQVETEDMDTKGTNEKSKTFRTQSTFGNSYHILDETLDQQTPNQTNNTSSPDEDDADRSTMREGDERDEEESETSKVNASAFAKLNQTLKDFSEEDVVHEGKVQLIQLLKSNFRSEFKPIQLLAIKAACKLLLLERLHSPAILSELIIIWFKSSTSLEIKHLLGTYLPLYAFSPVQSKTQKGNQNSRQKCLMECFFNTIDQLYRLSRGDFNLSVRSDYYDEGIDADNVISFIFEMMMKENQIFILQKTCKHIVQIMKIERDDDFEMKEPFLSNYLITTLFRFRFHQISKVDLRRLALLVETIETEPRFESLNRKSATRFNKFADKVRSLLEKMCDVPDTSVHRMDVSLFEADGGEADGGEADGGEADGPATEAAETSVETEERRPDENDGHEADDGDEEEMRTDQSSTEEGQSRESNEGDELTEMISSL